MFRKLIILSVIMTILAPVHRLSAQINTDQVMRIGQNTLYFEDYVLSIQYFNRVINVKPYLAQPYFYRAVAKLNLDDYLGAEADATRAIERNPFIVDAWEVRGVARQNLGRDREAIADYTKALEMLPDNRNLLFNKALAQEAVDSLAAADSTYVTLMRRFPNFDSGYLGRARLRLLQKDTVSAKADIEQALKLNPNAVNGYVMRADIAINSGADYESALKDMDAAIKLQPRHAGFFINRAFLRYMTDDFNGAFADYDYALQLEPENTIAIFNRGLLRAEVHDNNKAVADFTRVLELSPDDYKTLYNRAIILAEIGDYKQSIADLDRLIEAFPDFAAAYFVRFDTKRRKGDMAGAERDYKKSLDLAKTKVVNNPLIPSQENRTGTSEEGESAGNSDTAETPGGLTQEEVKRRFSSLTTIADNSRPEQIYNSKEIRGKVQDRNIVVELEPIFLVTYYTSPTELKESGDYLREVDDINATRALRFVLQVTNREPASTDEDVAKRHFESIGYYNSYLSTHTPRAIDYLGRAMDFMTLKDYDNAIADLTKAIEMTPDFTLAYLLRANARYLSSRISGHRGEENAPQGALADNPQTSVRLAIADLDKVIELSPRMPAAYYNKGVILASQGDYTSALQAFGKAIELKPDFGEAFYNRGYSYLTLGNREAAFSDLSRAGALGIVPSYNILKRMSVK